MLTMLVGAGGVIAILFKLLIASKDKEITSITMQWTKDVAELTSLKKSYQSIAEEAMKSALDTTNYFRAKEGKEPLQMLVPVIPESHSASTAIQRETAHIQTLRAAVAQMKLAGGQPPKEEPERGE